jgi:putative transferase (TIGR04331 family)
MVKLVNSSDRKKYLITNFHKLNYPNDSRLIFIDECLFNLYSTEDKSAYKCSYIYSIDKLNNLFNSFNNIIKKKIPIYRKHFKDLLNDYHKVNDSEKYWGLIIDQFLIILLKSIILEIILFQKIQVKKFHIIYATIKKPNIFDTSAFVIYSRSNDFKKLISSLVLKELGNKFVNFKIINTGKIQKKNKKKIYISILRSFIRFYIYLVKPILIVNGYMGMKQSIKFFFRSFGKIINVPEPILFNEIYNNILIDKNFRKKIKILEKDIIDKIFNKIVGNILPISYIENFNSIKKNYIKISRKIKIIGTGSSHYHSDHFNILTSEILKNNSAKFLVFQHGGGISTTNNLESNYKDQNYAFRRYYFENRKGLGMHFFNQKKISLQELSKRSVILILNGAVSIGSVPYNYYQSRFVNLDPSVIFFSKLQKKEKKNVLIKLFPEKNSFIVKKFWQKKFVSKLNFLPIYSNSRKKNFYKAKLVILNDISTALYELLFCGVPFILICNQSTLEAWQYNKSFKKKFNKLKKLNVFFNDPVKAANFVNSINENYLIEEWWQEIRNTKIFLDFKNFLIVEKESYLPRMIKELKNLNK